MKEIASATDFILAQVCLLLGLLALKRKFSGAWISMFASLCLASLAGGITHAFFDSVGTLGHQIFWDMTLLSIGGTALSCFRIAVNIWRFSSAQPEKRQSQALNIFSIALLLFYAIFVLSGSRPFLIAIALYLPASIFLLAAIIKQARAPGAPPSLPGIIGMCLTFAAAGIQQSKLSISQLGLDYNALYHIIQGWGLLALYMYAFNWHKRSNKS